MPADSPRPPRPEDLTWDELREHAEGNWRLTGPNSQGGTRLYRYQGRLFVVGYGDHSSLPGGAEQVIAVRPDNTPGFAPLLEGGHAAGCCHDPHWDSDWWAHRTFLLKIQRGVVRLFEDANETWNCPLEAFTRPGSPQGADVLAKLGPAVLDEALRCARARPRPGKDAVGPPGPRGR
ncbi:MAG TPA: hypothetical protein VJU18_19855 [Vicinamibacteria bacterium]|nr:hypothetical protein [Vicinamibacteria bacterium]